MHTKADISIEAIVGQGCLDELLYVIKSDAFTAGVYSAAKRIYHCSECVCETILMKLH